MLSAASPWVKARSLVFRWIMVRPRPACARKAPGSKSRFFFSGILIFVALIFSCKYFPFAIQPPQKGWGARFLVMAGQRFSLPITLISSSFMRLTEPETYGETRFACVKFFFLRGRAQLHPGAPAC